MRKNDKMATDVQLRKVAKVIAKRLPVEGDEFTAKTTEVLLQIKKLTPQNRIALTTALTFASKAPSQEREDLFGELYLKLLESKIEDGKLLYAIARCDWKDWWKAYRIREHFSLDLLTEERQTNEERIEYHAELLVGEVEFERVESEIDARILWAKLPKHIQTIVAKRLHGSKGKQGKWTYYVSATERSQLKRWLASQPEVLATR